MTEAFDAYFVNVMVALGKLVILAILLERGLYFIFDYTKWRDKLEGKGLRAPIALAAAWIICWWYDFDIVAALLDPAAITNFGIFITATIVAGVSSAAIVLFQDVMKFGRSARKQMSEFDRRKKEAELAKIEAERKKSEAEIKKAEAEIKKAEEIISTSTP